MLYRDAKLYRLLGEFFCWFALDLFSRTPRLITRTQQPSKLVTEVFDEPLSAFGAAQEPAHRRRVRFALFLNETAREFRSL